jgi:exonuclease III
VNRFFVHQRIVLAIKRVEFVSARMSYIVMRSSWCNIIFLNVHESTEERSDDSKYSFYEELEGVFYHFRKHRMKILLGDFNAKMGRKDAFKPTTGTESLHQVSNDHGVRVVNFATSKNLVVKSTMFLQLNIHKYTWTSPDGKTHNHIDHILVDRRSHGELTVKLIPIWWLQKLGNDTQHRSVIWRDLISRCLVN